MIMLLVNGQTRSLDCPPDTPLLDALRNFAGLEGTHRGCLIGMCGACTVHVDGMAVRSCGIPVGQVQGQSITTIEGLEATPLGRALAQAWADHAVSPCGHCRPGQMMTAAALLASNPAPGDGEIDAALEHIVCDCNERGDARQAVRQAVRALAAV